MPQRASRTTILGRNLMNRVAVEPAMASENAPATRPPGPDGLPFLGNLHQFTRDRLGFVERNAREYGDVVYVEFAGEPIYQLFDPDAVRHVLVDNNQNYVKGEFFQRQLGFLGDGLLTSEGERWRRQRHMVEPAFHPDRIAGYADTMVEYTERAVEGWADGEVRNVHQDMMGLTLEIVGKALFDVDVREDARGVGDAMSAVMHHFQRSTARPIDIPDWVPTPANVRYRRALAHLDDVVADIVAQRRRAGVDAGDVVSMLLSARDEAGGGMADETIRDQVLTLLLAGHETTAQALTFTFHLLARNPEVERRLLDELDAVLDGESPTMADLPDLEYTEQVVTEAMRLYPPVHALVREPVADDEIAGYRIPAGATVGMYQWVTHRDPRHYEDPTAFVPERWADESDRHPFAYFPFGGGPRRCIGDRFAMLEARLLVATIVQRAHLQLVSDPELSLSPAITLRPADAVEMRVNRR
jgi:cytochrome P450